MVCHAYCQVLLPGGGIFVCRGCRKKIVSHHVPGVTTGGPKPTNLAHCGWETNPLVSGFLLMRATEAPQTPPPVAPLYRACFERCASALC